MFTGKLELLKVDAEKFACAHREWIAKMLVGVIKYRPLPAVLEGGGGLSSPPATEERDEWELVFEKELKSKNVGGQ
ncbi:hypothetical protein GOBAR_AA31310 [Gossypium barbadense]|uniref:Uncharacterized protein n=1 Tax=Gossypium barbadense TaxID=3634 RepID=A0A2P5WE69_GOSBA|nr:hypothetical protein GOBAR_AA31310 [Gossypium barbadense]